MCAKGTYTSSRKLDYLPNDSVPINLGQYVADLQSTPISLHRRLEGSTNPNRYCKIELEATADAA